MPRFLLFLLFLVVHLVCCETLKLQKPIQTTADPSRSILPTTVSPIAAQSRAGTFLPARSSTLATVKTPKQHMKGVPNYSIPQTRANDRPNPTKSAPYLSTYTDFGGTVLGCTALTTLTSAINSYKAGDVACFGKAVPITSIIVANTPEIEASLSARPTGANATPVPFTNCKPVTKDNGDTWCECDGDTIQHMKNYTDSLITQLICDGDSLPGNWVETPLTGPGSSDWMLDPEANVCKDVNADSNDTSPAICWEKLALESYIEWWWNSFNSTCVETTTRTAFADCFLDKVMNNGPNLCSQFFSNGACKMPTFSTDPLAWNSHRNFWVSVSSALKDFLGFYSQTPANISIRWLFGR
jgi:hypothetical protein